MASSLIPLRPADFVSPLNQQEQAALTWFVLSGCSRRAAFLIFARPDMILSGTKPMVDKTIREFFASKDAKEYIEAYQNTIDAFLHPKPVTKTGSGSMEERKARAKTKLVEFAMSLADNIEQAADPEFVLKVADKVNLLEQDEQVEEQPRRYLPVSCRECEYRKFVEENCERIDDSGTEIEE